MKGLIAYLKACLIGGILLVLPLLLALVLIRRGSQLIGEALRPLARLAPIQGVGPIMIQDLLGLLVLLVLCLIAGVIISTRPGTRVAGWLERLANRRVPGYAFFRSVTRNIAGLERESDLGVALARIEEAWVIAFIVERHDGDLYTVFVPSAPTPAAGSIYFLTSDRVRPIDVQVGTALSCIMRLGVGSKALLAKAGQLDPTDATDTLSRPASNAAAPANPAAST